MNSKRALCEIVRSVSSVSRQPKSHFYHGLLCRSARERWHGRFDRVVLVEGAHTSTSAQARLAGVLVGLRDFVGTVEESKVIHLHGNADREASRSAMAGLLMREDSRARLHVSGFNDISAIGVSDAVRAARREKSVAIVGHNAMREGRMAIRAQGSPFIASVAYFPERYGERLVKLACAMAAGETVPPAVYTEHAVLDQGNLDTAYPGEESIKCARESTRAASLGSRHQG